MAKDMRSELRTRFGITATALFVVTAVSLIAFASADEEMPRPIVAAVMWVVMFFTAITGLARGFVSEEERGTSLYLRMTAHPGAVYWGKLAGNVVFAVVSNLLVSALFLLFMQRVVVENPVAFLTTTVVGSIGLASVVTITSAIVAKAGARNVLLPVLSFPVLLPVIMPGVGAMISSLAGIAMAEITPDWLLMLSHSGIVIVLSWLVFESVWCN